MWKDWEAGGEGMSRDKMVGWHHLLMDLSSGWAQELVVDRRASALDCGVAKKSDMTGDIDLN